MATPTLTEVSKSNVLIRRFARVRSTVEICVSFAVESVFSWGSLNAGQLSKRPLQLKDPLWHLIYLELLMFVSYVSVTASLVSVCTKDLVTLDVCLSARKPIQSFPGPNPTGRCLQCLRCAAFSPVLSSSDHSPTLDSGMQLMTSHATR